MLGKTSLGRPGIYPRHKLNRINRALAPAVCFSLDFELFNVPASTTASTNSHNPIPFFVAFAEFSGKVFTNLSAPVDVRNQGKSLYVFLSGVWLAVEKKAQQASILACNVHD